MATLTFTKEQACEFIRKQIANLNLGEVTVVIEDNTSVEDSVENSMYELIGLDLIPRVHPEHHGILAIKFIRHVFGMGLKEAKDCFVNKQVPELTHRQKENALDLLHNQEMGYRPLMDYLFFRAKG